MIKNLILPLFLAGTVSCLAGGFRVAFQGVRQMAMGHTSAHVADASALFFNPAAMSFIPKKVSVSAGAFALSSQVDFINRRTQTASKTNNPIGTPAYGAVAVRVLPQLSVGVSFTTPFGSSINWGEWGGSELVKQINLRSYFIQPSLSYKILPQLSVGLGLIYAKGTLEWERNIHNLNGSVHLSDHKADGYGFNAGVFIQPVEALNLSVAYRSKVKINAQDGMAKFTLPQSLINGGLALAKDTFSSSLPLVDEFLFGIGFKMSEKWSIYADFDLQFWSNYERLQLDFQKSNVAPSTTTPKRITILKKYRDSGIYRLGTQYILNKTVALRLGYYHDQTPIEDAHWSPDTPSFNNNVFTAGLGLKIKGLGVDLATGYVLGNPRKVSNYTYNFHGQAQGHAFFVGLGLNYNIL